MSGSRSLVRIAAPVVVAGVIALGLTACGSSSKAATTASTAAPPPDVPSTVTSTSTTSGAQTATTTSIAIQGFSFKPSPARAKVGDTITVSNSDGTDHTLTADDGSFDTGRFSSGSRTITLAKAGSFAYHCAVHNFMTGIIQVSS